MSGALLISVRLHEGRYNGNADWPPSPRRLFQALVAGAGLSGPLAKDVCEALVWLEEREAAPLIGAPVARAGKRMMLYMPNNDLDAVGGDTRRIAEVRTAKKFFRPLLFDASVPFLYAWPLEAAGHDKPHLRVICVLADRLYQLGRGLDMAWAWADVLTGSELQQVLWGYPGRIYRPSHFSNDSKLDCPRPGSLKSLKVRYEAYGTRFRMSGKGKAAKVVFVKPPKPSFRAVGYDTPPDLRLYDLRSQSTERTFAPWPLARASKLVVCLRDGVVHRLRFALPAARQAEIDAVLVGRKPDGTNDGPTAARVRIVPLPSIGHQHADHAIRRVLVEVPASCPLRADDVHWAFSGLELVDRDTGEVLDVILSPAIDYSMLDHYGIRPPATSRVWRSVTPVALPEVAARRRIGPTRRHEEVKGGRERLSEQARTAGAVVQALRHAEIAERPELIRVQREPFEANGERVEAFAVETRFAKNRLWHVEITFAARLTGPVVIGDGRFLGLGVMTPVSNAEASHDGSGDSAQQA